MIWEDGQVPDVPEFERLDDDALHAYLSGAASDRGERFVVGQREREWVAEFRFDNPLGGEGVRVSGNGADRRTAMLRLAYLVANAV